MENPSFTAKDKSTSENSLNTSLGRSGNYSPPQITHNQPAGAQASESISMAPLAPQISNPALIGIPDLDSNSFNLEMLPTCKLMGEGLRQELVYLLHPDFFNVSQDQLMLSLMDTILQLYIRNRCVLKKFLTYGKDRADMTMILGYLHQVAPFPWIQLHHRVDTIYSAFKKFAPGFQDSEWFSLMKMGNQELLHWMEHRLTQTDEARLWWKNMINMYNVTPDAWKWEEDKFELIMTLQNPSWAGYITLTKLQITSRIAQNTSKELDEIKEKLQVQAQNNKKLTQIIEELTSKLAILQQKLEVLQKQQDDKFKVDYTLASSSCNNSRRNSVSLEETSRGQSTPTLSLKMPQSEPTLQKSSQFIFGSDLKALAKPDSQNKGFVKPTARPLSECGGLKISAGSGFISMKKSIVPRETIISNLSYDTLKRFAGQVLYLDHRFFALTFKHFLDPSSLESLSRIRPWTKPWVNKPNRGRGYEDDYPQGLRWSFPVKEELTQWCVKYFRACMFHPFDAEILFEVIWKFCGCPMSAENDPGLSLVYSYRYPKVLSMITLTGGMEPEKFKEIFRQFGYDNAVETDFGWRICINRENINDFRTDRILYVWKSERLDIENLVRTWKDMGADDCEVNFKLPVIRRRDLEPCGETPTIRKSINTSGEI